MPASLVLLVLLMQSPAAPPAAAPIADNSFLIEEAYNQDRGVVQHISTFSRDWQDGGWTYAFTQEWPVNAAPRHQLSYSIAAVAPGGAGTGFGDVWVNWRYQALSTRRTAIAPRVSVLLPTGSVAAGRGAGGAGIEGALPLSRDVSARIAAHTNIAATFVPRAQDSSGDRARTTGVRVGQSLIFRARPRVDGLVEALFSRQQSVVGADRTAWSTTFVLNPGVRWAYDRPHGMQIVPGVSVPVTFQRGGSTRSALLLSFSVEHPFGSAR